MLRGLSTDSSTVYVAKTLKLFTRTIDEFRKHNLKAKRSKCQFGTVKITYATLDLGWFWQKIHDEVI